MILIDLLSELVRREKDAGILPEPEVDLFMKSIAAENVKSSLITDYTLKVMASLLTYSRPWYIDLIHVHHMIIGVQGYSVIT